MRTSTSRSVIAASIVVASVLLDAGVVMAQIAESDVGAQPGSIETTQLVTSSTEVRRAVIGLLAVAFVAGLLTIVYWYKTGQQARERFMRRHGGRHMAGPDGDRSRPRGGARRRRVATHPGYSGEPGRRPAMIPATTAPPHHRGPGPGDHLATNPTPTWTPAAPPARPTWPAEPLPAAAPRRRRDHYGHG